MKSHMRKKSRIFYLLVLGGISFTLVFAGCAAFSGKELNRYTYEQITPPAKKPSIDYDLKFLIYNPSFAGGDRESAPDGRNFQEEVEEIFGKSQVFSKFSAETGSEKYHLSLSLYYVDNTFSNNQAGYWGAFTLWIIPTYTTTKYTLGVDVKKGNQVLKHYEYNDSMRTWSELLLIFISPFHSPTNVQKEVMDNMLLNFLHDLENDNLLI